MDPALNVEVLCKVRAGPVVKGRSGARGAGWLAGRAGAPCSVGGQSGCGGVCGKRGRGVCVCV